MLVRIQFGSRFGQVRDFLPAEARAMLADGRAVLPTDEEVAARNAAIVNSDPVIAHRDPTPGATRDNPRPARRRGR